MPDDNVIASDSESMPDDISAAASDSESVQDNYGTVSGSESNGICTIPVPVIVLYLYVMSIVLSFTPRV